MLPNNNKVLTIITVSASKNAWIHRFTIESFMEKNPPCKNCLVQNMCIKQDKDHIHNFIRLEVCDKFKEFWCKYQMEKK